jgi:osmoprotectant transport system permease protein
VGARGEKEELGVGFLGDVWNWFGDGSHWSGNDGVIHRLTEHVQISIVSIAAAALIALPIGFFIGHVRKGGIAAVNISNIGRALPSFALLILMVQIFGIGEPSGAFSFIGSFPTFIVLVALAIPPMLTNTYIGMVGVDPEVREAARGMGMSGRQLLRGVEAPIALPLVWAGIRTGAIAVVATATLAAYTGWGGLGRFIIDGLSTQDYVQVFAGAVLVAMLAIVFEFGLAGLQHLTVSRGLRVSARPERRVEGAVPEVAPTAAAPPRPAA